jgi:hypothetical protein
MPLPFWMSPSAWGLTGTHRDRAELEYLMRHREISTTEYEERVIEINFADNLIDELERDLELTRLHHPGDKEALLKVRRDHNDLTEMEYEKAMADLKEEPWIAVIDSGFDPDKGTSGVYFEFDWNSKWIDYLRANGYSGSSESSVVDAWFTDVCRAQGMSPVEGQPVPFAGGRRAW